MANDTIQPNSLNKKQMTGSHNWKVQGQFYIQMSSSLSLSLSQYLASLPVLVPRSDGVSPHGGKMAASSSHLVQGHWVKHVFLVQGSH